MKMKTFLSIIFCFIALLVSSQQASRIVEIETSYGTIRILLYDNTPLHRDNFLKLVEQGFYNGTLFHRVIQSFMIQGGDPDSKNARPNQLLGQGGPGYTIPAEIIPENYHKRGAVAAARLPDEVNPKRESSGSQFYIVQGRTYTEQELSQIERRLGIRFTEDQKRTYLTVGGAPHLDGSYTVFGEVISGMEVVDEIAKVKTDRNNRPVQDIPMKIKIIK